MEEANDIARQLIQARNSKDPCAVEDAVIAGARAEENSPQYVETLIALLETDWHQRHEDIARQLQDLRDPIAIPALLRTAYRKFDYFPDESHALARKCTHALAAIGTHEAKEALTKISDNPDKEVSGYAQRRLDRWQYERYLDGKVEPIKTRAKSTSRTISWSEFKIGRIVNQSRVSLTPTTVVPDVMDEMILLCSRLDPDFEIEMIKPNDFTSASLEFFIVGSQFRVWVSRRLVRGLFPLNLFAAEFGRNYDVLFLPDAPDEILMEIRNRVASYTYLGGKS